MDIYITLLAVINDIKSNKIKKIFFLNGLSTLTTKFLLIYYKIYDSTEELSYNEVVSFFFNENDI